MATHLPSGLLGSLPRLPQPAPRPRPSGLIDSLRRLGRVPPQPRPSDRSALGDILAGIHGENRRKLVAWNRATPIPGWDERVWRHDAFGITIRFEDYGKRDRQHGWEIDHIVAVGERGCGR